MTNYRATTRSGRVYVIEDGHWWTEPESFYGGVIRHFKVVDRPFEGDTWQDLYDLPDVTQPEVGKSLFLGTSLSNWRLSTPIVEVFEYE